MLTAREVSQVTTGFSPSDMVFACSVYGAEGLLRVKDDNVLGIRHVVGLKHQNSQKCE